MSKDVENDADVVKLMITKTITVRVEPCDFFQIQGGK